MNAAFYCFGYLTILENIRTDTFICRKKWVSYSIVGFFDYIRKRIKYFYNPAFAHLEDDKNVSGSITFNVVGV